MKWFLFFGSILLVTLFAVTTFSHSSAARTEAASYFPNDVIERGLQYSFERRLLFWPLIALRLGLLVVLVETGLARKVTDWIHAKVRGRWLATVILVGLVYFVVDEALSLPFAVGHFELARAWGLTDRGLEDWLEDHIKGLGVAAVMDGFVLVGFYLLMRWFPRRWWLVATAAGTLLGITYAFLAPVVIEPIFNTFTPLGETRWSNLEGMVRSLVARAGVPVKDILVVDASRQGNHSNAYFTGFGATRRIVLYDNLLKSHPPAEVESILAHELGHWRRHHIVKGIALGAVSGLLGLFVLAQVLLMAVGRGRLALRSPSDPAGLPLIVLLVLVGSWLVMPVSNAITRSFERQADADSLELARQPEAFIAAEKRLAIDNVGNVAPLPFSVWLFSTHPPPVERIQMAEEWQREMTDHLETFLTVLRKSIHENTFVKLTLGRPRESGSNLLKVLVKPVTLARGDQLCFVYRHAAKDVTKNCPIDEGLSLIRAALGADFLNANLFTTANNVELALDKKQRGRLRFTKPTHTDLPSKEHNRAKKRPIASQGTPYLALLGVTLADGTVKKGMEHKYRQINRFIEIVESLIRSSSLERVGSISVVDMGSGKGYLTFAIYDYLNNILKKRVRVAGVEIRKDLVDTCNHVAEAVGFADLHFECGAIQDYPVAKTDVFIALHACDTATDEALFKAIQAQASLVLCAPCCHKELRPQLRCAVPGLEKVLKSGILRERQSELLTDGLRALLLEAFGYKASVFEFIATEHTSKNIMIAAVKTAKPPDREGALRHVEALKKAFGIQSQHLEVLLMSEAGKTPGPHI